MGPKNKNPPSLPPQERGDKLKEIDLKTVAWEKSFNVILLLPEDQRSDDVLRSVIESTSGYHIPITFINRDNISSANLENCALPTSLDSIVPSEDLTWWTKLRLVEALHVNRLRREQEIERSRTLDEDLKALTKGCYKNKEEKRNATRTDATLALQKSNPQAETEQIVFDDDLLCHVWTYALYGFDDIGFLESLMVDFNVPIVAIVKVKLVGKATETPTQSERDPYAEQCAKLDKSHFQSYLQNTGTMTFSTSSVDHKQILEELIYTTKFITDLKLMHLHYVRHLQIIRPESTYPPSPPECLHTYGSMLGGIASALRTPELVLSGLLEELFGGKRGSVPQKGQRAGAKCRDPCALRNVFGRVPKEKPVVRRYPTYLLHEADGLNVALKFDRGSAPALFDLTTKIWKVGDAFRDMDDVPKRRVLHKHDRNPSDEDAAICISEKQQHLTMVLLFALLDSEFEEPTEESSDDDFADLLDVYNPQEFFERLTKIPMSSSSISPNTYDVNISEFIWAEELPSDALIQEITKAQRTYSYFKRRYSDELDGYLYIFSDELDFDGVNIESYDETLSTVPNLRDFCRYVVFERADWLRSNPTPTYKRGTGDLEAGCGCEMFADLYPEYGALLTKASSSSSAPSPSSIPFGSILQDVQGYPSIDGLEAECGKESPRIPTHDVNKRFVSVKGLRTTFFSHDGVKLIVDNTGFIDEEPKCSVNLISEAFRLVLHSGKALLKEDYAFQLFFDGDDSFVTFCFPSSTPSSFSPNPEEDKPDDDDEPDNEEPKDDLPELEKLTEAKVKCAFKSAFEDLDFRPEQKVHPDVGKLLRTAVEVGEGDEENIEIFKVEADVKYVEAVDPLTEVPLGDVVRRIVEASVVEEAKDDFIKRYVPVGRKPRSPRLNRDPLDFKITLRDGLHVSCYRARPDDAVEIKQEHLGDLPEGNVSSGEEFRLFTRSGTVLIKRTDGNIAILRSNGDQVLLEKPDGDDLPVRKCRCKKPSDYKRKLNKLFKSERKNREDGIKRGYIPSDVLEVLTSCKIPYKKVSIVNFEGMKTSLTGNRVSQKRHCLNIVERDHASEEVFYERSDGLKCKTTRQSQCIIWFPDGTKITTEASMRAELIDGYVLVSLRKTYEHPEYAPVTFDEDESLSLTLPNDVIVTRTISNVVQCDSGVMSVEVKFDGVKFIRTCRDCTFRYSCNFNIDPLVTKTMDDTTRRFVTSLDSYGKEFYSDFNGVCEVNSDFLPGPANVYGCNHTNGNVYKKLFFVKKNLTGKQLWTTGMIDSKKRFFKGDVVTIPECDALKFLTHVYHPVVDRSCLRKSSEPPEPDLFYTTYRTLRKIVDVDVDMRPFFQYLAAELEEHGCPEGRIVGTVDDFAAEMELAAAIREAEEKEEVVEENVCRCEKVTVSVEEKVEKWRREKEKCWEMIRSGKVDKYFDSEFCRVVGENERQTKGRTKTSGKTAMAAGLTPWIASGAALLELEAGAAAPTAATRWTPNRGRGSWHAARRKRREGVVRRRGPAPLWFLHVSKIFTS